MQELSEITSNRSRFIFWISITVVIIVMALMYMNGMIKLAAIWDSKPEYSHGYLIAILSLFLVWMRRNDLKELSLSGVWIGPLILLLGLFLYLIGEIYSFQTILRYSLVVVLAGLTLSLLGWRGLFLLSPALFMLLFMFPLPGGLYSTISSELQTLSSHLGVAVIRLLGISVYLEGNVIDLGVYKLEVAEACSGLRYLFPLLSFGFICAYLFKASFWLRAIVFVSSVPIAILMNGLRIGVTGLLVDRYGIAAANGFLHDFEGWFIFMACIAMLIAEIWLLSKLARLDSFREVFNIEFHQTSKNENHLRSVALPVPYIAAITVLVSAAVLVNLLPERVSSPPERNNFKSFPMELGQWIGKRNALEALYLNVLQMSDYLLVDYQNQNQESVNLYIAYYASSTTGEFMHSPSGCIPSDGWIVTNESKNALGDVTIAGLPVTVTRSQIHKGDYKQLVYYWVLQGGHPLDERLFTMSLYRLRDGIIRNRTDNALIRLVTPVKLTETWEDADKRLQAFARLVVPELPAYLPD